jgi:hypothetical protein
MHPGALGVPEWRARIKGTGVLADGYLSKPE